VIERNEISKSQPQTDLSTNPSMEELLSRVAELERRLENPAPEAASSGEGETASNRRSFLRLAGATTIGVAAATLGSATRAAAANGENIVQGSNTQGTTTTTVTNTTAGNTVSPNAEAGLKGVGGSNAVGVLGTATGENGAGVTGSTDGGYAVYGEANTGYSLFAGGSGRIGMFPHIQAGSDVPTSGVYGLGDVFRNSVGDMYVCVVAGAKSPSTTRTFQKIAGPSAAGAIHLLPTPTRIFDSRASQPPFSGPKGTVTNGWEFLFAPPVAAGAKAAIVSLLVFDTLSDGYLTAWEDGRSNPGTINAFWSKGMQTASTTFVALSPGGQFRLYCANNPGGVNIAIDLLGFLR
jgi:hypothetical protein